MVFFKEGSALQVLLSDTYPTSRDFNVSKRLHFLARWRLPFPDGSSCGVFSNQPDEIRVNVTELSTQH